jgi:H+/Cl- antiporter ClcA
MKSSQPTPDATDSFSFSEWLKQWRDRLQPSPEAIILLLAVLVGVGAGAGVVLFRTLIHLMQVLMFGEVASSLSAGGHWTLALIPVLGGLIVGGLRLWWKEFGPGLKTLIEVAQGKRELQPLNPLTKMIAASISLGSGASLGPEGPSVEIGAYFSLLLGQVLKVSQERQRLLLSAGAAAGLAAGFNAPIAGVFFALEVVLGSTFAVSSASVVLVAAVVSAWIAQIGLGSEPAFSLPAYEVRSLLELPLYLGLGLLASVVSLIHVNLLRWSKAAFDGKISGLQWLVKIPRSLHPMIAGTILGLVSIAGLPQILGIGYETVEAILQDVQFSFNLVVILLVVKLLMTSLSFGSGFVGGVFAPALFLGASLGSSYGKGLAIALPMLDKFIASPPAYAMVGMAAVLAASVRAPLTAVMLLFELTQDYRIVLPLMAAVGLSSWLMEQQLRQDVVIDNTIEKKVEPSLLEELPAHSFQVAEVMHPIGLKMLGTSLLLDAVQAMVTQQSSNVLVVDESNELIGILTPRDVNRLLNRPITDSEQQIQAICTKTVVSTFADEMVEEAIARMSTRGLRQLPVVSRENPRQLLGMLDQADVERMQTMAATKDLLQRYLAKQVAQSLDSVATNV